MERILQGGMERRYGTVVWNGCGPGACSGPPILTCTHIYIKDIIGYNNGDIIMGYNNGDIMGILTR